jgi:HAD superfamily hydrolase (TIGR01450 family)
VTPDTDGADDVVALPDREFDVYAFDLDGTIYLGDGLLPGAKELVETLRDRDHTVRFLSNNPTKDPDEYAEKLDGLGLPTPVEEIVNTTVTTTHWLLEHAPDAVVYPISEEPLKRAFRAAGIAMSEDPAEIDIVVASYDRTFEYRKLQIAFDAIWFHRRAILITSNPDRFCPFPGGRGEPDAAAVVAAIEACTGTTCVANLGKPGAEMVETVLGMVGLSVDRCVMVGDRLYTDIAMAARAGMDSALVLTGETTPEMAATLTADTAPTWVLGGIDHLLPAGADERRG